MGHVGHHVLPQSLRLLQSRRHLIKSLAYLGHFDAAPSLDLLIQIAGGDSPGCCCQALQGRAQATVQESANNQYQDHGQRCTDKQRLLHTVKKLLFRLARLRVAAIGKRRTTQGPPACSK